jgi:hypothetical protein
MSRMNEIGLFLFAVLAVMVMSFPVQAEEDNFVKWYGVGGQITEPHRWLGRLGITEDLGAEIIFGFEHRSDDCGNESDGKDCDFTRMDIGAGFIYDFVPASKLTPYIAGRFILTMLGNGSSETSGTVEAAGGVEYVIMRRLGISGELNFNFGTNPSKVMTTTVVRCYFYL